MKLPAVLAVLLIVLVRPSSVATRCEGELVAYLTAPKAVSPLGFESDLMIRAMGRSVGQELEFINLDSYFSRIQRFQQAAQRLGTLDQGSGYQRVDIKISSRFASWFDGQGFGTRDGFESQVSLDAFADSSSPSPLLLAEEETLRIATLRVDFGGLDLRSGDSVTLDLLGQTDEVGARTTSFVLRDPTTQTASLVEPVFRRPGENTETNEDAAFESTMTIAVVPEPTTLMPLCLGSLFAFVLRRRRSGRAARASDP